VQSPRPDNHDLEFSTISRTIQLYIDLSGSKTIRLMLLDGFYALKTGASGYELLPNDVSATDSYYLPYESTQVLDAIKTYEVEPSKIELLAYVRCMAVGGVEQNTIAILKSLNRDSAILASKRPDNEVGDLTKVAMNFGIPVVTIIDKDEATCDLYKVSEALKIDWLWICNWSDEDQMKNSNFYKRSRGFRIADQRSYDHSLGWINTIDRDYIKRVETIVATNAPIKSRLINDFGKRYSNKIEIIRSTLRFSSEELDFCVEAHESCAFYQISRIVPQKRIDRGLNLSYALKSHGFADSWKIVGDGFLRPKLEISAWPNEFVDFIGFQDSQGALRNACALIQTSDFEGLPLVIIEALSMGIPVFSTMTGDLEWLRDQLPQACRPMLELIRFEDLTDIESRFLDWRVNFETRCITSIRKMTSEFVKDLFDVQKSAESYSHLFEFSPNLTLKPIE
jgi:glycosyltransferase involved in cell wall biosynthesis